MDIGEQDPAVVGMWEPIRDRFNYLPIHMALLRTGKVLAFGGSGNDPEHLKDPYPSEIWDPETGKVSVLDQALDGDLFCVGHVFLPDGRLIAAGGTYRYNRPLVGPLGIPFRGLDQAYAFDPATESWTRLPNMRGGRWYPSLLSLGDGRVLAVAGFTKRFPWAFRRDVEIYSPDCGWRRLERACRWLPIYPRLHLIPGGVFYSGSYNTHYVYPFRLKGFPTAILELATLTWRTVGTPRRSQREEGASILLPLVPPDYRPRVLLVGGGTPQGKEATALAEIIDLSGQNPTWRQLSSGMHHARYWVYSVILPDRRVLVLGGRGGETGHHGPAPQPLMQAHTHAPSGEVPQDPRAVHQAELFDPDTEEWSALASMKVDRLYHSNAVLLPDGRVMVAGSNPERKVNELRIEIYSPPYLFRGPRPTISEIPREIGYDQTFEVATPHAADVSEVALIRPSATTHCLDNDQRYVGLLCRPAGGTTLAVKAPGDRDLAPPGFYMAFIVRAGIPSTARFVRLG